MTWIWFFSAIVLGFGVASALVPALPVSRGVLIGLRLALGAGLGPGITATLFFVGKYAGLSSTGALIALETVCLLVIALLARRSLSSAVPAPRQEPSFRWNMALAGALGLAVLLMTWGVVDSFETNPHGDWDAWSIWNVRARMLASDAWQNAFSPLLDQSHPDYPLLLSGFVARTWQFSGGGTPQSVPATASALFLFASLAVCLTGLAASRRTSLGLIAALVLAASSGFVLQGPVQYADLPVAFYFLAAIVLLCLADVYAEHSRPLLAGAGLSASLAAWTKNEGLVFLGVALLTWVALRRRGVVPLLAGALPVAAIALAFRFAIAPAADPFVKQGIGGALPRFGDAERYSQVLSAFATEIVNIGTPITHPVVMLAILFLTLRTDWVKQRATAILLGVIALTMLIAYGAIFIATPSDLTWHLGTAAGRLIGQVWPLVIFAAVFALRTPESYQPEPVEVRKKP